MSSDKKGMWLQIGHAIVCAVHWLTCWLVHPEKGGCCSVEEDIRDLFDKEKK